MLCLAFGKTEDVTYSGGSDGNVFVWSGVNLQKTVKAHEGPLFAMHSLDKVNTLADFFIYYQGCYSPTKLNIILILNPLLHSDAF